MYLCFIYELINKNAASSCGGEGWKDEQQSIESGCSIPETKNADETLAAGNDLPGGSGCVRRDLCADPAGDHYDRPASDTQRGDAYRVDR